MKKYIFLVVFIFPFLVIFCKENPANSNDRQETKLQVGDSLKIIATGFVFGDNRPFAQCHASTLVYTNDDKFLVAWFGGTNEGNNDVGIWLSKGTPDGWSYPAEVAKINDQPHWNPVLFKTPAGEIILYFKVGPSPSEWATWYKVSGDNGETWSLARGPVRNKPIILLDGSWLAGSSDEKNNVWNVFCDRSTDQGKTWINTPFIPADRDSITGRGVIQPTLWESSPGVVHMFMRSTNGSLCRSDSKDYGQTWSEVYKTGLPNNNAAIDVTKLDDGTLVLAFNNLSTDGIRTPINVAVSKDNGETWPTIIKMEHFKGVEFSYPAIISMGNKIYGTYTWRSRQRIAFWIGEMTDPE